MIVRHACAQQRLSGKRSPSRSMVLVPCVQEASCAASSHRLAARSSLQSFLAAGRSSGALLIFSDNRPSRPPPDRHDLELAYEHGCPQAEVLGRLRLRCTFHSGRFCTGQRLPRTRTAQRHHLPCCPRPRLGSTPGSPMPLPGPACDVSIVGSQRMTVRVWNLPPAQSWSAAERWRKVISQSSIASVPPSPSIVYADIAATW